MVNFSEIFFFLIVFGFLTTFLAASFATGFAVIFDTIDSDLKM
jgi:hypothetical protein